MPAHGAVVRDSTSCRRTGRGAAGSVLASLVLAMMAMVAMLAIVGAPTPALAQQLQPIPPLQARVTDRTGTLTPPQLADIDASLADLETRKGSQVVVLLVPTTSPEAIEQYSIRVAETWKIGRGKVDGKAVDDGVILLVAKNDRRVRIEVGYGLEGAIPDALASRIISEAIAPRFRNGDFYGGIKAGVADIIARVDGEPLPPAWHDASRSQSQEGNWLEALLPVLLIGLVGGMILSQIVGRFLGAAAGAIGTGVLGLPLLGSLPAVAVAAVIVFFLVLLMGQSRRRGLNRVGPRTYRDRPVILPGPWGGRGGGGFGGGGGGFGGGGGGFGGGGASGGW